MDKKSDKAHSGPSIAINSNEDYTPQWPGKKIVQTITRNKLSRSIRIKE